MYTFYMKFKLWKITYSWLTTSDSILSEIFLNYVGIFQFKFECWKESNILFFWIKNESLRNVALTQSGNKNSSSQYHSCHAFKKEKKEK